LGQSQAAYSAQRGFPAAEEEDVREAWIDLVSGSSVASVIDGSK